MIKNIRMPSSGMLRDIYHEFFHVTFLFPDDTDGILLLTAKDAANEWSDWVEITDGSTTLSSKLATSDGHITYLIVETVSANDKVYIVELAYGDDKTIVGRARFYGGSVPKQSQKMYSDVIPAGETVYYRMKCEQASGTAEAHLRYHLHT